jgi:REP element-mobilizing transposase RayT
MGGHQIKNQYTLHYLTLTVVGWVDVFTRDAYRQVIIESLEYCQKHKGLHLCSFVLMSNHLHLIAYAEPVSNSVRGETSTGLSNILRDFKKFTGKKIIDLIQTIAESRSEWMLMVFAYHAKYNKRNRKYQFWQQHNHPIELFNPHWINQKILYVHLNPVRNKLVEKPEHYRYSSASNYVAGTGVLDVEIIDLGLSIGYIST